jgi:hypothetical protein
MVLRARKGPNSMKTIPLVNGEYPAKMLGAKKKERVLIHWEEPRGLMAGNGTKMKAKPTPAFLVPDAADRQENVCYDHAGACAG